MFKENSMNISGNKLFQFLFFIFLLSGIFLFKVPNSKAVGDAYFPNNTTLQVTVGSTLTSYTINGGSDADSLVVNASSFVITISAGQRFVVSSPDRHTFTNDSGYSTICPSGSDSSSLDVTVTTTQKVVTVTPSSTACSTSNSGGGSSGGGNSSGGGGGGASTTIATQSPPLSSPTPSSVLLPSITLLPTLTPSTVPVPSVAPSKFTRDLHFGMSGDDVKALQDYLRASGFYTNSNSTGFFDTPTKKAVIAWQKKNKLLSKGYFGSYSRAKYNQNRTPLTRKVTLKNVLSLKPGVNFINVRISPSTGTKIVGKIKAGQQIHFIDKQNGWYKIQNSDGSFGWILGQYVIIK